MPKLNIDFSKNNDPISYNGWNFGNLSVFPVVTDGHDRGSGHTEFIGWLPNEFDPNRVRGHHASFFTHPGPGVDHASTLTHGPEYIPNFLYLRGTGFGDLRLHTAAPNYPEINLPSRVDIEAFPPQGLVEVPAGSGHFVDGVFAQRVRDFRVAHFEAINSARGNSFTAFDILGGLLGDDSASVRIEKSNLDEPATVVTAGQLITSPSLFAEYDLRIKGGSGTDIITGHRMGANVMIGTLGQDSLTGGLKNDLFDYQLEGLTGTTFGLSQSINGRAEEVGGKDSVLLLGSPSEYQIEVFYGGTFTQPNWSDSFITVKRGPEIGPPTQIFHLTEVESLAFQDNTNNVSPTGGKLAIEALQLANESYGSRAPLHGLERLAYEGSHPDLFYQTTVTDAAEARGWRPMASIEVGIKPADYNEHGTLRYSMLDGFYAARDARVEDSSDAQGNAIVLTGVVNGKKTLAIAFRGTDQVADVDNFNDMAGYYNLFKPLTDGIKSYLETASIDQVIVSGHSLGASAVQRFLAENPDTASTRFIGYTMGSPGSENPAADNRIINFVHTGDPVAAIPDVASTTGKLALGVLALAIGALGGPAGEIAAIAMAAGLLAANNKDRIGIDIELDSPIGNGYSFSEHTDTNYVSSLTRLHRHANDAASPFFASALALALREDTAYAGAPMRVAVGRTGEFNNSDSIKPENEDAFVLLGDGDDEVRLDGVSDAEPTFGTIRFIDGGTGTDRIVFDALQSFVTIDPVAGLPGVFDIAEGFPGFRSPVGRFSRFESMVFPGALFGEYVMPLGGAALPVQQAIPGSLEMQVNPTFHHADAGDGARRVIGSTRGDLILYGDGAKTIDGFLGDDIILPKNVGVAAAPGIGAPPGPSGATLDPITMDGNDGDDFLRGGDGNDSLNGAHDDDTLMGGLGFDTLEGGEDVGDMDVVSAVIAKTQVYIDLLDQAGGPAFMNDGAGWDRYSNIEGAFGGSAADFLSGDSGVNLFRGNDGADAILGRGGDDTLEGGEGSDLLMGGATYNPAETGTGADRIEGGAGSDLIFGGDGDDVVFGGDDADFILAGSGNDAIEGEAGDDFLFGGSAFAFDLAGAGDDTFNGGDGVDVMVGGQGADSLFGGNGDDIIYAGSGNDGIGGWDGNDTLFGDAGNDVIAAGAGFDFIYGGAGGDVFAFRKGDSYDTVFDFAAAQGDKLRLDPALGVTTFAQFQTRVAGFTFEGVAYSVLNFAALGFNDQITLKGIAHTAWTSAMVEFA